MSLFISIIQNNLNLLGIKKGSRILDVGCGNGDYVSRLCAIGYDAYGVDIKFKEGRNNEKLIKTKRIMLIDIGNKDRVSLRKGDKYIWPKFTKKFEVVVSMAVIEHVNNIDDFIYNILKVINPLNGVCIHYYPSKLSVIEPHTGVPFGAILKYELWFRIMCYFNLCFKNYRNEGLKAYKYMRDFTFFRFHKNLDKIFKNYGFDKLEYTKNQLNSHPSKFFRILSNMSFFVYLFEIFRSRVVVYKLIKKNRDNIL